MVQKSKKHTHMKRNIFIGVGALALLVGLGVWVINRSIDVDLFNVNEDLGIGS